MSIEKSAGLRRCLPRYKCALILAACVASFLAPSISSAQNLGSANIGTTSASVSVPVTISSAGTLSSIAVRTGGVTGLDFASTSGGSCATGTSYSIGSSCTVNVTFTPEYVGSRYGAVVLADSSGNVLGTSYINGVGTGPQLIFSPATQGVVAAALSHPTDLAVDGAGNVYTTEYFGNDVLKETPSNGTNTQTTVATGLNGPFGVAVDGAGNVYIADSGNNRVLKETPSNGGYVQTIVVNGLNGPYKVAVDGNGNVYIAEYTGNDVLKETLSNGSYTQSVVASGLQGPWGVAVDGSDNVYIAEYTGNDVLEETLSGGSYTQSTVASGLGAPQSVAVDGVGNVYIGDSGANDALKETLSNGAYTQTAIATGLLDPSGIAVDGSGNVYIADSSHGQLLKEDDADAPTLAFAATAVGSTSSDSPQTITLENLGNASLTFPAPSSGNNPSISTNFVLGTGSGSTCPVVASGSSSATLGAEQSCTLAISFHPTVAGSLTGTVTLTDSTLNAAAPGYATQNIDLSGSSTGSTAQTITFNSISTQPVGGSVALTASASSGLVVSFASETTSVCTVSGSTATLLGGGTCRIQATQAGNSVYAPASPVTQSFTAEYLGGTQTGTNFGSVNIGTTSATVPVPVTINTAGTLGSIEVLTGGVTGLDFASASGGTCATGTSYSVGNTCSVAVTFTPKYAGNRYGAVVLQDSSGNVLGTAYVYGTGTGPQVVFSPLTQSMVAENLSHPTDLAVDGEGNIYTTEYFGNDALKETLSNGTYTQSTVATGLSGPFGVAVDGAGDVYIADSGNNRVLKETPSNGAYAQTVVASGLNGPYKVAVDGSGNVFIAEYTGNDVIEEALSNGAYTRNLIASGLKGPWGVAVDSGDDVYIAEYTGNDVLKETLSNGSYTQSTVASGLGAPQSVAVDGVGNVYIGDSGANDALMETLSGGSYAQSVITTGLSDPSGIAADGAGNVYIADSSHGQLLKEDYTDAPSLTFAATAVGSTSSDSPKTVTLENLGNASLAFPVPASGNNPSISTNFVLGTGGSACPVVASGSSPAALNAEQSCTLSISYQPTEVGVLTGTLAITDNTLNAPSPGYTTQNISLGVLQVATPIASPVAGAYSSLPTVTLSDATAGATICYTTDGSDPTATTAGTCSNGTTYSGGFSLSGPATVKAIGTEVGYVNSPELTSAYTLSPIAFVQDKECSTTGAALTCTFKLPVTAGDALMVFVSPQNTTSTAYTLSVSDNLNGAWTQNGSTCFSPNNAEAATFYSLNSHAGNVTVTITSSTSTEMNASIAEYSGIATSNAVDVPASCTYANSTNIVAPNVTTTNANDLILASPGFAGNGGTITVGSPYTLRSSDPQCSPLIADQLVSAVGTYAGAAFTLQNSEAGFGITATYKAAGTSAPVSVSVSPTTTTLYQGQTQQFTASVTNTSNTAVTWTINPSGTGTISGTGLYTAPASISGQEAVIVTATSVADPTISSSSIITLSVAGPNIVVAANAGTTYLPSQAVTLSLAAKNTGSAAASTVNIVTTDPNATNTTVPAFSLSAGSSSTLQSTYTVPALPAAPAPQPLPPSTDASLFNVNLIVNGNAEAAPGGLNDTVAASIPGWTTSGNFTTQVYGNCCGFPLPTDPGPANRGSNFFYGGPGDPSSSAVQSIDVSSAAELIDSGIVSYNFSAWLGGYSSQGDNAVITAAFLDSNGNTISTSVLGPVTAQDRGNVTELLQRTTQGSLPAGTRTVSITMVMTRLAGSDNDGYADNLSFVLSGPSGSADIDADTAKYLQTLAAADESPLAFGISTSWINAAGASFGPITTQAQAMEVLPVVCVSLSASSTGISGSTITYSATITNTGHAEAQNLAASLTLPDGTVQQLSLPTTSLAPQASMQATASYTVPLSQTSGMMFARAEVSWADSANNSYGPVVSTTSTSIAQLATLLQNDTLTAAAANSGPYILGTSQTFIATLADPNGAPVSGISVNFNVSGTNTTSGTSITNATGKATFTYSGSTAGIDNVQASINLGPAELTSNGVPAYWVSPTQAVSTTPISGTFFSADGTGVFNATSSTPVAFSQSFPTLAFNAPTTAVTNDSAGTIEASNSFTDTATDTSGNYSGILPTQAASGSLTAFQAAFTGSLLVSSAGSVTFTVYSDDGFVFGIGNGAVSSGGPSVNPPQSGQTALSGLSVMGADNQAGLPSTGNTITVNFPQAGTYPYELDYATTGATTPVLTLASSANSGLIVPPVSALLLTPISEASQSVGGTQTATVNVTDINGNPIANQAVTLNVTGANPNVFSIHYITDSNGNVTYSYTGSNAGIDSLQATAFLYGSWVPSNALTVQWGTQSTGGTASVSITANSTVTLPSSLLLTGVATGFGGSYTSSWIQVSGPGTVSFSNPNQLSTNATFSTAGVYVLQLAVTAGALTGSAQVTVDVNAIGQTPQGWIGNPIYGSTVTGIVPITVAYGITVQSGTLTYYPTNNSSDVTVLNSNVSGSGQIGVLDTTELPNGSYWIQLQATDTTGDSEYSLILVTVAGDYKPGRVTASVTDLVVPANGLSIQIQRNYDSLNAGTIGDFGYGWNLSTNVNLSVDPKGNVTLTLNGQRKTFYFAPQPLGFPFPYYVPAFTPEPGLHGTLTDSSSGCADYFDILVPDGSLWDCIGGGQYQPTGYIYTDPSGTSYVISATGALQGIEDKNGNALSITASGIMSSTGLSVSFVRDSRGRITQITDPQGNEYRYTYDANGNLATVTYPGLSQSSTYTYAANHYYTGGTDARGNPLPTTAYYGPTDTDPNGLPLNGRLESVTDGLGETTSYAYDLANNITTVTYPPDASGAVGKATMVYDSYGDLLSSTDPLGHTTTNAYDANRNLVSATDPLGNVTTYTYDANGNQTSVTYPKTTTSTNTMSSTAYNQYSEPTSTTDELGNVRTFTYDANYNPLTVTDADGTLASFLFNPNGTLQDGAIGYDITATPSAESQFTYDTDGDLTSRTDALGRTTSYTYNNLGQKLTMTIPVPSGSDASAATTTYTYDALGNLTQTAAPLGRTTSSTYDANGNKLTDTDALGHVTQYQYDALNRLIKTTYPDSTIDTRTYDFRNNLVDEVDQAGHDTHYTYDLAGRLASVTKASGTPNAATIGYTYDNDGRKLSETDPDGHTTAYSYDAAGNLTSVSGPGGTFQYTYDNARNRISVTDGNGHTTVYQYDARKRLVQTTYPDGTFTVDAYDGPGNLISVTDQAGNVVEYSYDSANQLKSVVEVNSPNSGQNTTSYNYDPDGNPIASVDANGHATSSTFDLLDDLTAKTLPDGTNTETRTYDYAGNLLSLRHFNGDTTTYTYDNLNRLLTQTPDATTGEVAVSYTYTPTGKRHTMTDASGTTTYTYDPLDRLTTKATPEGTLNYAYDAAGNLGSMSTADGNVSVSYTWDSLNRLSTVVDNKLTGSSNTTTYTYDNAGNVVTVAYPNGVKATLGYDQLNRVTSVEVPNTNAGYLYTRGPTGNLATDTELNNRSINWSYDGIYRLTGETISNDPSKVNGSAAYGLDPVGNRLSATSTISGVNSGSFSYNADDELANETYDADGNVLTSGGKMFAYDSNDRLKSMNGGAVTITYDGDGNRVAKTVNGMTTHYLVDDLNPTGYPQVVEETGSVERTYTYGLQRIDEDQVINGAWTPSFYGYDGLGNVRNLTNTSGATTDTYEYDAYGNLLNSTGTTPNAYMYRGEAYDSDLGLYYLRARWMNPLTGRFLSRDPEGGETTAPETLHKYLYADGDPVNAKDPTGRDSILETGSLDLTIDEPSLPALREFGQTSVRILCDGIETVAKYIPTVSGPYMTQLSLIRLFANVCTGLGY